MHTKRLTPNDLRQLDKPGRYSDGGGLYFVIDRQRNCRWVFLYKSRTQTYANGLPKPIELGLGSGPEFFKPAGTNETKILASLADARRKATAHRKLLSDGFDPKDVKRASKAAKREAAKVEERAALTFGEFANTFVEGYTESLKNDVSKRAWVYSIGIQCEPLRSKPIADVNTDDVLGVLRPIWAKTPESAKRLQSRIEKVWNAAKVAGKVTGENPARWVGHLKLTDLTTRKVQDRVNHGAVPFKDMPDFMAELRQRNSISARALEWTVLTAARTGETIGATWREIDLAERVWIVPANRMKKSREHRVPLTDTLVAILEALKTFTPQELTDYIFQSGESRRPLSNMAMAEQLKGMRGKGPTVHGMRSSFSDWANETTTHESQTIEFCLAHILGDKAEAAYRRGTQLEKRRAVLNDWDSYLSATLPAAQN